MGIISTIIEETRRKKSGFYTAPESIYENTEQIFATGLTEQNYTNVDKKLGDTDIINRGLKVSKNGSYLDLLDVPNPLHTPVIIFDTINKYRGVLKYTTNTVSGPVGDRPEGENPNVMMYSQISSPSLFNPYYAVPAAGIVPGVPLLDTSKNNDNISAIDETSPNGAKTVNSQIKLVNTDDCSISNLVKLSNEKNSILGQARYKYTDFMYCRDVGKISNNRLITLRRFATPVGDNIFQHTPIKDNVSNIEMSGDMGRLITWFGTEENKLEDIFKYTYKATWKPLEAKFDDKESQETDKDRGVVGGLVNLFNPKYNQATNSGVAPSALALVLGESGSNVFLSSAPYANNPAVNGTRYDQNKVYEPQDTVRSTHTYEGKLEFNHEFTLTFNYKLRGYNNINAKSAFLDLLANILIVTYRQGTFWPGEQRIIGAPRNTVGWNKAMSFISKGLDAGGTFLGDLLAGGKLDDVGGTFAQAISSMISGSFGIDLSSVLSDPMGAANDILQKIKDKGFGSAIKGSIMNKLGRPAVYAFDSLLQGDAVGLWHLTIGNPLNPIASMGNLIIDNCEISHSGPLGIDDFPTELKVVITLKHATPRDSVDIQRMYTKGRSAIYSKISNNKNYKLDFPNDIIEPKDKKEGVDSKTKIISDSMSANSEIDVSKIDISNYTTSHASWMGDFDSFRINEVRKILK